LQIANACSLPKLTALALCGLGALSLTADAVGEFSAALKVLRGAEADRSRVDADVNLSALLAENLSGVARCSPLRNGG
jgi:hypothetical protein